MEVSYAMSMNSLCKDVVQTTTYVAEPRFVIN